MRKRYLRDCQPGDVVEDVFILSEKQIATGSNGKQYIKGFISDRSAQLVMRLWNATQELFDDLPQSGFVWARARIEQYQSNLQAVIERIAPPEEGSYDLGDLMPQTTKDIGQMCGKIQELLGSVQNRHLAALLQAYLDDEELMRNFCRAPAAQTFHHAFIGGLLEHTLNAMEVADAVVKFYPGLSRDLMLAGIFLHDIAKTWELSYDTAFGYTDGGHLVGHVVKAAIWVEDKARDAEKLIGEKVPRELIDTLQHIVLSHHGLPEHGAAKSPATPEAIAVHSLENLDAKLTMALSYTRGDGARAEGNWTEYLKMFGGRLYRPDVTAAEPPAVEPDPARTEPQPPQRPTPKTPQPAGDGSADRLSITNPLFESISSRRK